VRLAVRVGAAELLWLALLAPVVLLPGRLLPMEWHWAAVVALFLFWPVRLWLLRTLLPPTPVRVAAALFLATVPTAIVVSVNRTVSWEIAGYLLYGVALAAAFCNWPVTQRRPHWVAWLLLAATLGLSLLGPLVVTEARFGAGLLVPLQRAAGPVAAALGETINPNILANALLMGFPLLLALALFGGWSRLRGWGQAGAGLLALWMVAVILLTNSRGAWLALGVVVPLLLVVRWVQLAYAVPLLVMGVATVAVLSGPQLLEGLTVGSTLDATSGIDQRVEIWQRGLLLIHAFPWSGAGMGAFPTLVPTLYPYDLVPGDIVIPDAHNLPIQVAVDVGVPGLVAWLALMLLLVLLAGLVVRWTRPALGLPTLSADDNPSPDGVLRRTRAVALQRALAAGALGALVAMLVSGSFGATNWGVKPAFLGWLVAALVVLLYARVQPPLSQPVQLPQPTPLPTNVPTRAGAVQ
jgi:putative inorganic carbon (HCO3(-)) transporter